MESDVDYVMRWIVQANAAKVAGRIPDNIARLAQRVLAARAEPAVKCNNCGGPTMHSGPTCYACLQRIESKLKG